MYYKWQQNMMNSTEYDILWYALKQAEKLFFQEFLF